MRVSSAKANENPSPAPSSTSRARLAAAGLGRGAVLRGQMLAQVLALGSQIRVQLERMPMDDSRCAGRLERPLELPPADHAPGADDIGHDVDPQRLRMGCVHDRCMLPEGRPRRYQAPTRSAIGMRGRPMTRDRRPLGKVLRVHARIACVTGAALPPRLRPSQKRCCPSNARRPRPPAARPRAASAPAASPPRSPRSPSGPPRARPRSRLEPAALRPHPAARTTTRSRLGSRVPRC